MAVVFLFIAVVASSFAWSNIEAMKEGNSKVIVSGELIQWHKVTLDLSGPFAHETDTSNCTIRG